MAEYIRLKADATLRSVVPTLDGKINFIADAYAVINRYNREHGPVVLRLGVSRISKGKRPNYRIDDAKTGDLVAVMNGSNHQHEWKQSSTLDRRGHQFDGRLEHGGDDVC